MKHLSDKEKWEAFKTLPALAQQLLEFTSFLSEGSSPQGLTMQFFSYHQYRKTTQPFVEEEIDDLKELGLLESVAGRVRCCPGIIENVSAHAAQEGRAKYICDYIRNSRGYRSYWLSFAQARRKLYCDDVAGFLELHRRHQDWKEKYSSAEREGEENEESFLERLTQGMVGPEVLDFYPAHFSALVCQESLVLSINQADSADFVLEWLRSRIHLPEFSESCKAIFHHQLFFREEHSLLDDPDFYGIFQEFIQGDTNRRGQLSEMLNEDPKALPFVTLEFLYLAACYADLDWPSTKERLANGSEPLREIHRWFWEVRSGIRTDLCPQIKERINDEFAAPIMVFMESCFVYWAGFGEAINSQRMLDLAQDFREANYYVIAREMRTLGLLLQEKITAPTPFLGLVEPINIWEQALTHLEDWASTTETVTKTRVPAQRIVWVFDPSDRLVPVRAKIQKINKSGNWTQGRQTQLDKLHEEAHRYLDPDDRRVLSTWALNNLSMYGRQRTDDLVASLIGHPRVVSLDGNPVTLDRGVPRLLVSESPTTLHLRLDPPTNLSAHVGLRQLGPDQFEVVTFEPQNAHLQKLIPQSGLKVPLSQTERIQQLLAAVSQAGLQVESCISAGDAVESKAAQAQLLLRLYPLFQGLKVELGVQPLGEEGPFYPVSEGPRYLLRRSDSQVWEYVRDFDEEIRIRDEVFDQVPLLTESESIFLSPRHSLELLETLRGYQSELLRVVWPQGQHLKVTRTLEWSQVRISVKKDRDWFAVSTKLELEGAEHIELSDLVEKHRQQGSRFLELDDGQYIALSEAFEERLKLLEETAAKEKDGEFFLDHLTGSIVLSDMHLDEVDQFWEETQKKLTSAQTLQAEIPKEFQGTLREYQREGFEWLARSAEWGVGVCLADDMGLGKTIQILALLLRRMDLGPTLVVAPTSVCSNWQEEASRFAPELNVSVLSETDRESVFKELGPRDVLICSYGLMVNEASKIRGIHWANLVLDESQAIKNHQTKRFKAVATIPADFRVAATGTPVENHLGDLWSLFRFLNPGLLGSFRQFTKRFMSGKTQKREVLRTLVSPFLLRRLKGEVLKDLPEKTDITLKVELSPKERLYYESLRLHAVERIEESGDGLIGILAELMRLRRACCHPRLVDPVSRLQSSKLERFVELLTDLLEAEHKVLVFSQFVDHLRVVRQELESRGIGYQYLDGSTPAKARSKAVDAFQAGVDEVFLISLKAGGTGLNLTAANYVIHLDPWWNPATEDQASDRAHRIGQKQAVTVYRLITKDTIEEKILALHKDKRELVDDLLAGTDKAAKLSSEELLRLLKESTLDSPVPDRVS